jgi:hypothetical protein
MAKIRLRVQQAGEIRRKHGCARASSGKVATGFPKDDAPPKKLKRQSIQLMGIAL